MPEKIGQDTYTPKSGYEIKMTIKDLSYTNDLREVTIMSAINKPYQVFVITMEIDSNDIILEDSIGNEPIKLYVRLLGRKRETQLLEDVNFELQHITTDSSATPKSNITTGKQKDRVRVDLWAVPRKAYKTMNTSVNCFYENKTPKEIIENLISTKTDAKVIYDTDSENKEKINELVLPPMTLYKVIQTLDNNYGLFDGACNLGFCQYDNQIHIQNLTKRMNKDQAFTIYQLSGGNSDNQSIIDKCGDGKNYYTEGTLKTDYQGPAVLQDLGSEVTYIVKPKDALYKKITKNIKKDIFSNYGATSKNKTIRTDSNLDNTRKRFIGWGHSGNDNSETFINSTLARKIVGLATVEFSMQKNLRLLNLMKIGEPVKLKTGTVEYNNLSDKYLLQASQIKFIRTAADWNSSCTVKLMRSNQYI